MHQQCPRACLVQTMNQCVQPAGRRFVHSKRSFGSLDVLSTNALLTGVCVTMVFVVTARHILSLLTPHLATHAVLFHQRHCLQVVQVPSM